MTEFGFACFSIERKSFQDLGESLSAHALAFQDLVKSVMAHPTVTFYPSNSNCENVTFDIFARKYLFRPLIFERCEFIVRGFLHLGEKAGTVATLLVTIGEEAEALHSEVSAMANGECH